MHAVTRFLKLAGENRFKGWPLVGESELGPKIPFFGQSLNYKLQTGNGIEEYTSILRHFGWAMTFGLTQVDGVTNVITLCQWKPGVNQASWELPPGGIGKIDPKATPKEILLKTEEVFLKETGYGNGIWKNLGHILIETGKYRGAGPDDHGLKAHLFLASHLEKISEKRMPNKNEIMETLMVPLEQFRDVLESGFFLEESGVVCAYKALLEIKTLTWKK